MKCARCRLEIQRGEEREYNQESLCEDCYIDALSPAKFCDPWADYAAKSFMENNPGSGLNENQVLIIEAIKEAGQADPQFLTDRLKGRMPPDVGQRETAALHRMGKILIENNKGQVVIKLP